MVVETRSWRVESLSCGDDPEARSRRAGERLLDLAAGLAPGSVVRLSFSGGGEGTVNVGLEVAADRTDLDDLVGWVWESVATVVEAPVPPSPDEVPRRVAEIVPAFRVPPSYDWEGGTSDNRQSGPQLLWPVPNPGSGMRLLTALASTSAEVRLHLAPARDVELPMVTRAMTGSVQAGDPLTMATYVGAPVEIRLLVGVDGDLSPRVRSALLRRGVGLALRWLDPESRDTSSAWRGETQSLAAMAQPHGLAQCLAIIPACGPTPERCGLPTVHPAATPMPIAADMCNSGLRLGTALGSDGGPREVRMAPPDLLLHTQVMGSTGAGKSSLLAALAHEAIHQGIGVTLLDPHGPLVDRVLGEIDPDDAEHVITVRSGSSEHPVAVNPFAGPDSSVVSDTFVSVLREIHDPGNQGFMGPVWERGFALLMAAQRALLGSRANLTLLPAMAADQRRLARLGKALGAVAPELAAEFRSTFVDRRPEDFAEFSTWMSAKFQRLVNSEEVRRILGSGADDVDVTAVMDAREVLLVDLASPTIGDQGAQMLGELWLIKHWVAMSRRRHAHQPHLLIVDEAHLFASGLLPRLLTQGRKFGIGVVVTHQNLEQLSSSLREAVLSSTNSVIAFRTGIREEFAARERLGSWAGGKLTRLPRLSAAASLETGAGHTDAFTLLVDHNDRLPRRDDGHAAAMEALGRGRFAHTGDDEVLSYSDLEATVTRILGDGRPVSPRPRPSAGSPFADEVLARDGRAPSQATPLRD